MFAVKNLFVKLYWPFHMYGVITALLAWYCNSGVHYTFFFAVAFVDFELMIALCDCCLIGLFPFMQVSWSPVPCRSEWPGIFVTPPGFVIASPLEALPDRAWHSTSPN